MTKAEHMKNIFVPTDFSACASNATYAALELATAYRATLHLHRIIEAPKDWSALPPEKQAKYPEVIQEIHKTEVLMEDWKEIALKKGTPVKAGWSCGKMIANINQYIESNDIDFVVMGSHGISGKNEYFLGSNTQKVVRAIHIPVLIIKEELADYRIKKVVFASQFHSSDKEAFQYLLKFVKPFKPEIHLAQIKTTSLFGEPFLLVKEAMNDFQKMCGDLTCKGHYYQDWTVDAGIRHLSEDIGADLIAISNQGRHPLKRIFTGSNVEALVNHSKVPVLSIDLGDIGQD